MEYRVHMCHVLPQPSCGEIWQIRMWVGSWNGGCPVTWVCYQLIAKTGNKTATVSWPDPYVILLRILIYTWASTKFSLVENSTNVASVTLPLYGTEMVNQTRQQYWPNLVFTNIPVTPVAKTGSPGALHSPGSPKHGRAQYKSSTKRNKWIPLDINLFI